MKDASSPSTILGHLRNLTGHFTDPETQQAIPYVSVYAELKNDKYVPVLAPGEGISCVDDVARTAILAFELYEFFHDNEAKDYAVELLKFLSYMTDSDGHVTNFLLSENGDRATDIPSSYPGGAWWTARAKWAFAKAFNLTSNQEYLELYNQISLSEDYDNAIAGILLLGELELGTEADPEIIQQYIIMITSCMKDGYFQHIAGEPTTHIWGYHEFEAIAKASRLPEYRQLTSLCESTINTLVTDLVTHKYYYDYPQRTQVGICGYCVAPFVRGLYEVYESSHDPNTLKLLKSSIDWFNGNNPSGIRLYDPNSGICLDGVDAGKVSTNAGAESAIEAGFCEIRRLLASSTENIQIW